MGGKSMKMQMELGTVGLINRKVTVTIDPEELKSIHLHLAFPAERNRTGLYMRRHQKPADVLAGIRVGPNHPLRTSRDPPKLKIAEHLEEMRQSGVLPCVPERVTRS